MKNNAIHTIVALLCGTVFGIGLSMSGMLNPERVQNFLDITGHWDPSLAFVLGGAVTVAFVGVSIARRMRRPVYEKEFFLPTSRQIDERLIIGSTIFGIGWGLGGFCPGPAIASLSVGLMPSFVFVSFMVIGMVLHDRLFAGKRS
ncbi:YeeE/YedE family protein [Rhizobium sp. 3T7]|uniref:YeeE/YedE family protein n=1 Tax=Rhizobium sp. 3T7 TaxID=2874922 RepID=UPI001CCD1957|nr:YeeE/YedE family protein [Rhizobium sp. 3T7]MBZ9791058.1 YeeE/YedE family protein [Rhizobium sp. 3T7]